MIRIRIRNRRGSLDGRWKNTNADGDDNGQVSGILGGVGFIESGAITLAAGTEPIDDGDGADGNLTLDFGVFRKLSIGNTVFDDTNNNGTQDGTETGVQNVSVRLLNPDAGNAMVATTTTNSQGQYLFTNLLAGNYAVELAASNFNAAAAASDDCRRRAMFSAAPIVATVMPCLNFIGSSE